MCRYEIDAILRDLHMESNSGRLHNFLCMSNENFEFVLHFISRQITKTDKRNQLFLVDIKRKSYQVSRKSSDFSSGHRA